MADDGDAYDLIIIGGGINGAGIARDAALRGLRVLLLEAEDFGSGTSSWSSRLIHGGLRYLEYGEIPLVYESLHERQRLRRIARHLIQPLRITIPIYRGGQRPRWLVRLGMQAYDLLSWRKQLPRHRMLSRDELIAEEPGVNPSGLRGGARYYDAQVTYAERLVIENIVAAAAAGAEVRNYAPVTNIDMRGDAVVGVHYRASATGALRRATARVIVNAAGPWVDRVLATAAAKQPRLMGGTKGSHIVVGAFSGAPRDAFYAETKSDGRPVFILPWNGQYLIGTTDIRYDGDPANAVPGAAEIEYLLAATNAVFPNARLAQSDIHYAYAGVRPLPYQAEGPESAITRRHIIYAHDAPAVGLLSIIGGKLTTYRNLAEQVVDRVADMRRESLPPCTTDSTLLPGAAGLEAAQAALARMPELPDSCRQRLLAVYGGKSLAIVDLVAGNRQLAACIDDAQSVLAAEVVFAIREEFARTLTDLMHRRLMIGLSGNLGADAADAVLGIAARELGWGPDIVDRERDALAAHNRRLLLNGGEAP